MLFSTHSLVKELATVSDKKAMGGGECKTAIGRGTQKAIGRGAQKAIGSFEKGPELIRRDDSAASP